MTNRPKTNSDHLGVNVSVRFDEAGHDKLVELASVNDKSKGELLRALVMRAHRNLPRTQAVSRELIQIRIMLNRLAQNEASAPLLADEIRRRLVDLDSAIRELRS